jgi:hypothetical protein
MSHQKQPAQNPSDPKLIQELIGDLELEARLHVSQENFGQALMLLVESQNLSEKLTRMKNG